MEEIIFEDEEVTFTFEGNDYSALVDFYDEEEWKLQSLTIWNPRKDEWLPITQNKIWLTNTKKLTQFTNNAIDSHGNNIFETAYTAKYEPTDWKDDYND